MIPILALLVLTVSAFAGPVEDKSIALGQCLEECWGVDPHTKAYILRKVSPFLENSNYHPLIDEWIEKSEKVQIDFSFPKEEQSLPEEDAIVSAPKHHSVVFENPYVRILLGSTPPGERGPFHSHAWNSLMLVTKPTTYEVEYPNGTIEIWDGPIGVYELAGKEYYAISNIGNSADELLLFEIKE